MRRISLGSGLLTIGVALALTMTTTSAQGAQTQYPVHWQSADTSDMPLPMQTSKVFAVAPHANDFVTANAYFKIHTEFDGPRNREMFILNDNKIDSYHAGVWWWVKTGGQVSNSGICDMTTSGGNGYCLIMNIPTGQRIYFVSALCKGEFQVDIRCSWPKNWVHRSETVSFLAS